MRPAGQGRTADFRVSGPGPEPPVYAIDAPQARGRPAAKPAPFPARTGNLPSTGVIDGSPGRRYH